jgi:hypothetical protein
MENEPKKAEEGELKPQKACPLCAKNRNEDEFKPTLIGALDKLECKIEICSLCQIVLHNARRIFAEAIKQMKEKQMAILQPSGGNIVTPKFVPPRGLNKIVNRNSQYGGK